MFKRIKKRIKKRITREIAAYRLSKRQVQDRVDRPVRLIGGEEGWTLCPEFVNEKSVVYSFGVGQNVDWDLAMIDEFGVTVHAFDPTSGSIQWVSEQCFPEKFVFHDCGISDFDGTLDFFPPKRPGGHYSQDVRKHTTPEHETVPGGVHRLTSIMRENQHHRIDVLKLDVEGSEFEAIPDILQQNVPIGQLLIEIHYHYPSRGFENGMKLIESIKRHGMRCFYVSARGYEFGFVHEDLVKQPVSAA